MIRAYLFALDPSDEQSEAMRSHCGAARVAYNWCLAQVRANWEQRRAEESYGIPEAERTPWINTSAYSLRKAWNAAKHEVAPWWAENSKEARNDTHQFTAQLIRDHDVIVIEDLRVAGMLRNRRLARHIAGAAWAEIRRQLSYKTERAGARLIVADRWYASSKTCSECGTAKAKLALSQRTFVCLACGTVLDRDENAARNLAALAANTGELRREQPDRTDVRPAQRAAVAVGSLREESYGSQRHRREAVTR